MLRVIIVDDERLARESLKSLLQCCALVEVVGEAEDLNSAICQVGEKQPHLVFMDIELGNSNGFDFLKVIKNPPLIAFVTAHANYATQAFIVNAIDYLLKPVTIDRLEETLKRARKILSHYPTQKSEELRTIEIRTPGKKIVTTINNIAAMRAERDYTHFFLVNQQPVMMYCSLLSLETSFQEPNFLRIGRSIIINLDCVRHIKINFENGATVALEGVNQELAISQAAAKRLRQALEKTI